MKRGELTPFESWIAARSQLSTTGDFADHCGASRATYYRRRNETPLPIEMVSSISKAAGVSLAHALIAAGWIDRVELDWPDTQTALESASDSALLTQLLHRAATREQDDHNDTGPSNSPSTPLAPVTGLHTDPLPYAALTEGDGNTMDNVPLEGDE